MTSMSGRPDRRQLARASVTSAALTLCMFLPAEAQAQTSDDDLRAEVRALRQRIDELEAKLAARAPAVPAQVVTNAPAVLAAAPAPLEQPASVRADRTNLEPGELPLGSTAPTYWRVPGSSTSIRLSGLIRFGAYKDLTDNLGSYKFRSGEIHPHGDPRRDQRGNIQSQMRLSRFSIDTKTPTGLGELFTTLGVDFAGAEPKTYQAEALQQNGYHLRLTHAYANLGTFPAFGVPSEVLIGQTWSNFLDDPDTAESVDPSGPASVPSERQPQLRYTARLGKHALSVAVENPIGDYQLPGTAAASSFNNTSTTNRWPDLTFKYETEQPWGRGQLSAVLRRFTIDDGNGHAASATGYGVIAGGTLFVGRDRIGGQMWFGDGIGKYVPDEFGNANGFAVANYGTDSIVAETQRSYGGTLWYRHFWAKNLRSNAAVGYARQDYAGFIVPAADQAPSIITAQVNIFVAPLPMLDLGLELQWGRKTFRRELNLDDADALRLGFTSRVKFN